MNTTVQRAGARVQAVFRATAPDPFVLAILLTALTAALAITLGFRGGEPVPMGERTGRLIGAWGVSGGLWGLLAFSMQMCLVLVTGHALAESRPVRSVLGTIAARPATPAAAAATVALVASIAGLINWGLGLIAGALLARATARALRRRGVEPNLPLLAAAGYMGMLVWHGGLSGSAPLSMSTWTSATAVLPRDVVDDIAARAGGDGIGLGATLASPMNLFITGGLIVLIPVVLILLAPRPAQATMPTLDEMPLGATPALGGSSDGRGGGEPRPGRVPEWLETSPLVVWTLAAAIVAGLVVYVKDRGAATLGLNEINAAMLALGLIFHGSARAYLAAAENAARGCAGIILQFPLYAGIMAMMRESGLAATFTHALIDVGDKGSIPVLSFLAAAGLNIFIPSGGGQWAVQGPIALKAGLDAGIDPAKMLMSVAYGDQLTNMLQPFWALPLLAITGAKARDIVGYTAVVMVVAGVWITLGLLIF
ncbi:MAG: short-chain fatty acid transporter [Phycisphaeraceae bacterium]|nr:MAG: short-chain fatty acid transporter [Phycisphaeraceae bacterium]